jgi:hypothetical protein
VGLASDLQCIIFFWRRSYFGGIAIDCVAKMALRIRSLFGTRLYILGADQKLFILAFTIEGKRPRFRSKISGIAALKLPMFGYFGKKVGISVTSAMD